MVRPHAASHVDNSKAPGWVGLARRTNMSDYCPPIRERLRHFENYLKPPVPEISVEFAEKSGLLQLAALRRRWERKGVVPSQSEVLRATKDDLKAKNELALSNAADRSQSRELQLQGQLIEMLEGTQFDSSREISRKDLNEIIWKVLNQFPGPINLDEKESAEHKSYIRNDLPKARQVYNAWAESNQQDCAGWGDNIDIEEIPAGSGVPRLVLTKPQTCKSNDMIVHVHGGSFMLGSPETHQHITATLAKKAKQPVLSVDYELAPEGGGDQSSQVAASIQRACELIGPDSGARITLFGDSSGGALLLLALVRLTPDFRSRISKIIMVYPGLGHTETTEIRNQGTKENGLSRDELRKAYAMFGEHDTLRDWDALIEKLPKNIMYCLVAPSNDPLRTDSEKFSMALRNAGHTVDLIRPDDLTHSFLHEVKFEDEEPSNRAGKALLDIVKRWFNAPPSGRTEMDTSK